MSVSLLARRCARTGRTEPGLVVEFCEFADGDAVPLVAQVNDVMARGDAHDGAIGITHQLAQLRENGSTMIIGETHQTVL